MKYNYNYSRDNYDNRVKFLSQGAIKREATTYSMETTTDGKIGNTSFVSKTTDENLLISELCKDLVNADQMVKQTRLERNVFLQSIEKIVSIGKITAEQAQMIINEIATQLSQEQSERKINK